MSATLDLFNKASKKLNWATPYAAAKAMDYSKESVYRWVKGGTMDDDTVLLLCEMTGENPAYWVPLIHAERAQAPAVKKFWKQIADKAARAAVVALVAVAFTLSPAPSDAETSIKSALSEVCILC